MNKYLRASVPLVIFPLSLVITSVKAVPIDIPQEIVILGEKMEEATRMGDYMYWYYYSEEMQRLYEMSGGSFTGGSDPTPVPPPPKKSCAQMVLDIEAVKDACVVIENNTALTLARACPDLIYYVEASASLGVSFKQVIDMVFGTTLGVTYNQQCEARLTFDLGAKLAACEFSASKSKAAIGPCN